MADLGIVMGIDLGVSSPTVAPPGVPATGISKAMWWCPECKVYFHNRAEMAGHWHACVDIRWYSWG